MATGAPLTAAEKLRLANKRQRSRSIAIAVSLAVLVALFYAATMVRMGNSGVLRPAVETKQGEAVRK